MCVGERRWTLARRRGYRLGARSRPAAARQRRGPLAIAGPAAPLPIPVQRSAAQGRRGHRPIPSARCHDARSSTGQARQSILHAGGRSCRGGSTGQCRGRGVYGRALRWTSTSLRVESLLRYVPSHTSEPDGAIQVAVSGSAIVGPVCWPLRASSLVRRCQPSVLATQSDAEPPELIDPRPGTRKLPATFSVGWYVSTCISRFCVVSLLNAEIQTSPPATMTYSGCNGWPAGGSRCSRVIAPVIGSILTSSDPASAHSAPDP